MRVAEVQMRLYPQDEVDSHDEELQQSVLILSWVAFFQGKNPVAIFNGFMVRRGVPEKTLSGHRQGTNGRAHEPSSLYGPGDTALTRRPCGRRRRLSCLINNG